MLASDEDFSVTFGDEKHLPAYRTLPTNDAGLFTVGATR